MAGRVNIFYNSEGFQTGRIRENLAAYQSAISAAKATLASPTTDVENFPNTLLNAIFNTLAIGEDNSGIEYLKTQIISGYEKVLSECHGIYRAFVKFSHPEAAEYGRLDCDFYFFVSRSLFFNIDELYEKTNQIRDYFEDELDVNIFYHYAIYHGQDLEEDVREEAQEINFERAEISTASQF